MELGIALDVTCLGCGREAEFPEEGSASRVLEVDGGNFYMDGQPPCPQCRATRIRLHVGMGVDSNG